MDHRFSSRQIAGVTLWLALVVTISSHWLGHAQQAATPPGDDPRFTGPTSTLDVGSLTVSRRRFEAGARSAWHSHEKGQLLFVEEGRARLQRRGQPVKELGPGESDYTPPSMVHWHGATSSQHLIQVAVGFGGETKWLDRVTDTEYAKKSE